MTKNQNLPASPVAGQPTAPTTPMQAPEGFISRKELAARLGRGVRTIDTWMREGIIPFYKINNKAVLFKYSEVEAHLRDTCRVCRGSR